MQKPQKIRAVYSELKQVFGDEIPSHVVLGFSSSLVEAIEDSIYEPKTYLGSNGRIPFSEMSVDLVMENYPWRVVCQEWDEEDDFFPTFPTQFLIEQRIAHNS